MALADSVIGELHLLEQMSSDEHLGSLAEAVLEAVKGHPEAAKRVEQVRHSFIYSFIHSFMHRIFHFFKLYLQFCYMFLFA